MAEIRQQKLDALQADAVEAWVKNGGIGTLQVATGVGKTIIAFKCIIAALELGWIQPGAYIRFFAETDARRHTLLEEFRAFRRLTGKDITSLVSINFYCYQSNNMTPADMDIYDEIHDALTAQYHKIIKYSKASYKLGLSAFIDSTQAVFPDTFIYALRQSDEDTRIGKHITKGQLIRILCPIVFTYSLSQAIADGILSTYETYIIDHQLDNTRKDIRIWASGKMGTEKDYYESRKSRITDPFSNTYVRKMMRIQMARFVWNLNSKVPVVLGLLKRLSGKTIIFGIEKSILRKITENVVEDKNAKDLVDKFNQDEITVIGVAKKLKQGITLAGVTNCIIVSYYSTPSDTIQRLGRIIRYKEGKVAKLFIIRTKETLEENAINQMVRLPAGKLDLNLKKIFDSKLLL